MSESKGWIEVQKKTFTRWVNHFLAEKMTKIENILTDFDTGVQLVILLELISSKKLGKTNLRPVSKFQKLENLNACLAFLAAEGIKLVNIGSEDIMNHNERAILGLIWTLILRYEINLGGDEDSPKNKLLKWVNAQIKPYGPDIPQVRNFNKDWRKGDVLSALADSLRPGLIDCKNFLNDPLRDTDNAMAKSQEAYDIPRLIDAQDMIGEADELSVMTYVAQFKRWQEEDEKRRALSGAKPDFTFADGPGVTKGLSGRDLPFTVYLKDGNDLPVTGPLKGIRLNATVEGPAGPVQVDLKDNGDGTATGSYPAKQPGDYKVNITLNDKPIKDAPYHCKVRPGADPPKTYADGPGLDKAAEGRPADFVVHAFDEQGQPVIGEDIRVDVRPLNDQKNRQDEPVPVRVVDNGDGTYNVSYLPENPGDYEITAAVVDKPIRDMPVTVRVTPAADASKTWADGPGLKKGFRGRPAYFTIHSVDKDGRPVPAGGENFDISAVGPDGGAVPAMVRDEKDGTYSGAYKPDRVGVFKLGIALKGHPIKDAPFTANIAEPADPNRSYAEGPGLKKAFNDTPAVFKVHAFDKDGQPVVGEDLTVEIVKAGTLPPSATHPHGAGAGAKPSAPSRPAPARPDGQSPTDSKSGAAPMVDDVKVVDNGDGTYDVSYLAPVPGVYDIWAKINREPIKDMPATVNVLEGLDASKTYADGPGVEKGFEGRELPFTIHAVDGAGQPLDVGGADFEVTLTDPEGNKTPLDVKDNGDGTYTGAYTPDQVGKYKVDIGLNGKPIKGSAFKVKVKKGANGKKSYAKGKGWRYAYDNVPSKFVVYAKDDNGDPVSGEIVQVSIRDATSVEQREKFASEGKLDMPETERRKKIRENAGLAPEEDQQAGPADISSGADIPATITDNGDGTYGVEYLAVVPGDYLITVTVGEKGDNIKDSPKPIKCYWSCPNKPCAPVQQDLHDEIHRLRKVITEYETASASGQALPQSGPAGSADSKKESDSLRRRLLEQETKQDRAQQELADLREELEVAKAAAGHAAHHHHDHDDQQHKQALASKDAEIAELRRLLEKQSGQQGDAQQAEVQRWSNIATAAEARLLEEQKLRADEHASFQKQMEEMMAAAEEMQGEFEAREQQWRSGGGAGAPTNSAEF